MSKLSTISLFLWALLLNACTINYSIGEDETETASDFVEEDTHKATDLLWIGPQPDENDLAALQNSGVQKVISFRSPSEIEDLDFDQQAELEALGIEFANIPISSKGYPYSPATVTTLRDELAGINVEDGPVLLHCGSGWRASVAAVAYLIQYEGMPLEDALQHAEGWWPLPLEKVLGKELELTVKD